MIGKVSRNLTVENAKQQVLGLHFYLFDNGELLRKLRQEHHMIKPLKRYSMEDIRRRKGKMHGGESEEETNHDRLDSGQ